MRILRVLLLVTAVSALSGAAFCVPDGVLKGVLRVIVDPTVVRNPVAVKDADAASLARYTLRAAFKEAYFEEGNTPIHAHIVLDEFYGNDSKIARVKHIGTGNSTHVVVGKLVIADADGKELASVPIEFRGSVGFSAGQAQNSVPGQATSDFEKLLLKDIEGLK